MSNFDRKSFFPINKKLNTSDLKSILKKYMLLSRVKENYFIDDISSLTNIRSDSILFVNKKIKNPVLTDNHIITDNRELFDNLDHVNIHLVKNIDYCYNLLLNLIFTHEDSINYYDEFFLNSNSYISKSAFIDKNTIIFNNCTVGKGVKIGKNCIIKNNVVLKNCIIGNNVIIGDNTTIGSTGFGFNLNLMGSKNISPHIGIVIIEDNVSIGSNCSIDRGKIENTVIGSNSMLDNQIHIAHNVLVGANSCIAGQCGIAGSTIIGNNVIIGGQSGLSGHLKIGNNVVIAAKSGVTKNLKDNSVVAGFPAVDIKEWKKSIINLKKYGYK